MNPLCITFAWRLRAATLLNTETESSMQRRTELRGMNCPALEMTLSEYPSIISITLQGDGYTEGSGMKSSCVTVFRGNTSSSSLQLHV